MKTKLARMACLDQLDRLDYAVSYQFYSLGRFVPRFVWKILEYSGDGLVWLTIAILTVVVGFNNRLDPGVEPLKLPSELGKEALLVGVNLLLGLIIDLCEVGLLKWVVKRPRPTYNTISNDMNIIVAVDAYSFPSGHSSRVSFLAQFAVMLYHEHSTPGIVMAWALIVSVSRCMMGRHYLTDVFAGLALGYLTLLLVTHGSMDTEAFKYNMEAISDLHSFVFSRKS